jgi:hypothetical protein
MNRCHLALSPLLALVLPACAAPPAPMPTAAPSITISATTRAKIGQRVWQNECAGSVSGLVSWNAGEDFASLGIGHFIWYPTTRKGPFDESFPHLLAFLQSRGQTLPSGLTPESLCPWIDRASFKAAEKSDPRVAELRSLLKATVPLQGEFLAQRCLTSLSKMQRACPTADRGRLTQRFQELTTTGDGLFCLIDYVNFKGEGVKPEERYASQGWGLMQVLLQMQGAGNIHFAQAAKAVLSRRVQNSPPARGEQRWIAGWHSRCDGYARGL